MGRRLYFVQASRHKGGVREEPLADSAATISAEADRAAGSGDFAHARLLLDKLVRDGGWTVDLSLRLAAICRAQGDMTAALDATGEALKLEPLHFLALLLRANLLERTGSSEADQAYGHAIAQRPSGELPPQLAAQLEHAERRFRSLQERTDAALSAVMDSAGFDLDGDEAARVARFRTNVSRLTSVYHSEPTDYHYPGLREREYHERTLFPWLEQLEAATDEIAAEFARVAEAERAELVPYVQYPEGVPLRQWQALNNSRAWTAIHLILNGERVEANARHCPRTLELLAGLPQPHVPGVSPNALFSLLAPGAHIPPHTGVANTRLVCHLPLIVPDGCWFRVGAERRDWRVGQGWVFDDTIEHEAMNESGALRVILICDVWHPDLSDRERAAVQALVAARARLNGHSVGIG